MKLRILLPLVVASLFVCGAREGGNAVVTHVAEAKKSAATIRFADEIRIILPVTIVGKSGASFEWQIISNESRVLRVTSSPKLVGPGEKTADGEKTTGPAPLSTWVASFVGLRPGRSIVRFTYVQTANTNQETQLDSREIIVTVR